MITQIIINYESSSGAVLLMSLLNIIIFQGSSTDLATRERKEPYILIHDEENDNHSFSLMIGEEKININPKQLSLS